MIRLLTVLFLFLLPVVACAQSRKLDSLRRVAASPANDTNKVNALNLLAWEMRNSKIDSSLTWLSESVSIAKELKYERGLAYAYSHMGVCYKNKGNYPVALRYHFLSLDIREKLSDKGGMGITLGNIGIVYQGLKEYEKALEYYHRSLVNAKEANSRKAIAAITGNIGVIYKDMHKDSLADVYYREALRLNRELGNEYSMGVQYGNIGLVFYEKKDFRHALIYYDSALTISLKLDDHQGNARNYTNMGAAYIEEGQIDKAEMYFNKGLYEARTIQDLSQVQSLLDNLHTVYLKKRNFRRSLETYKQYIAVRDSVFNEENTKQNVQTEMNFEFAKKESTDSIRNAEQQKQEKLKHENEIHQQRLFTYGGAAGFILMMIVAIVSFRAFRNKQKANHIIAHQKNLVEEKQKEILDSIHYAKRIQRSLLPSEKYIERKLKH